MKTQLLAITFCLFILLSQTSAAKKSPKGRQNATLDAQEVTSINNDGWTDYMKDYVMNIDLKGCFTSVGDAIGTVITGVVVPVYEMIANYSDINFYGKALFTVGLIAAIANFMAQKDRKNEVLAKQILDLNEKVDKLLNKAVVEDITTTSEIYTIKEKLELLTQNLSKTEGSVQTQATTQQKTDEFIQKFTKEILDSQATMLKELTSLKKIANAKPAPQITHLSSSKRDLNREIAPQSAVHIDTSATTPLLSATFIQAPVSAAKKPSAFKVSIAKNSFKLNAERKDSNPDSASPVSISIPFGAAGKPLSEILSSTSPVKGLRNPFEASRVLGGKQKENLLQFSSERVI